jgi:threonine dehydrogenase-like Zn-dependent dehydrogenase
VSTVTTGMAWEVHDRALRLVPASVTVDGSTTSLVQVRYSGVCGSDAAKLAPDWPDPLPDGWRPGHEIVGSDARTGAWVVVDPLVPCGTCDRCAVGSIQLCPGLRRIGWDLPGGFADTVAVPPASLVPVAGLADPAHGVLADALAVALHGVRCGLGPPTGRLGVIGSGVLAVCTAVCAKAVGWRVHQLVRDPDRAARLRQLFGITVVGRAAELPGCEAVVDAASGGTDLPLRQALDAVRDGGTVLVQTAYRPGVTLTAPVREVFRRSVTVRGSFSYCRAGGRDDFRDALAMLAAARGWPDLLTRTRFRLEDLPAAVALLHAGGSRRPYRIVLTPHTEEE